MKPTARSTVRRGWDQPTTGGTFAATREMRAVEGAGTSDVGREESLRVVEGAETLGVSLEQSRGAVVCPNKPDSDRRRYPEGIRCVVQGRSVRREEPLMALAAAERPG